MAVTYNLGIFPDWQIIYPNSAPANLIGLPIPGARVFTYRSTAHTTPKTTYQSNVGNPPPANTNPVEADSLGQVVIYWELNDLDATDLYFVQIKGPSGDDTIYYTFDNFNGAAVVPGSNINTNIDINYIRNAQFSVWEHIPVEYTGGTSLNAKKFSTTEIELVCDDWWFFKDSVTATDTISREVFLSGQTDVPANPSFFIRYNCSILGTTETQKYFAQYYKGVQTFNGEYMSFSIWIRANSNARTVTFKWVQYFGSGGSPAATVTYIIGTKNLTTSWAEYKVENFQLPSIVGKAIGTNRDDYCSLQIFLDNNTISTYDLSTVQLEKGSTCSIFQQDTYEGYKAKLSPYFQTPTAHQKFIFKNITLDYPLGEEAGWAPMNDLTIANSSVAGGAGTIRTFAAFKLYCVLWNTANDTDCPVSTGRGVDAVADWNADKTIRLPLSLRKATANYGSGRRAGETYGSETHTQSTAEVGSHTHTGTVSIPYGEVLGGGPAYLHSPTFASDIHALSINATAAATPMDIMNPTSYSPFYIHL